VRRALVTAIFVAGGLGALAVWFYPSHTDFQSANPQWNGLSEFVREWNVTPLDSLGLLPQNPLGTALVVIPYRAVARADVERIRRYLERGGVVMLLDDFGFGNQVLQGLGFQARFTGSPLLDPLFNYKNRWLPEIAPVSVLPPGSVVILNHASALTQTSGMTVVARSSRYSFLDVNGNGAADPGESRGPLAVAAWARVGRGVLFVASDPSFLINGMLGLGSNRQFVRQVLRFAGDHPRVFLDEAHLPALPLDRAKMALRSTRRLLASPPVLVAVLLASAAGPLALTLRRWNIDVGR
jgi:hypothetical protein